MTLRTAAFIATSLDGFIARPDGALDWLLGADSSGADHGYDAFIAPVDVVVMGRHTFGTVLTFDAWPFPERRTVVLSTTLRAADVPAALVERVELHPGPVAALVRHLADTSARHAYVDGGRVIQSFLAAGALDEITVTRIPVLIGRGIPLFADLGRDVALEHRRTVAYESGFVQSTYAVRAAGAAAPPDGG